MIASDRSGGLKIVTELLYTTALIVGAGLSISASLARQLTSAGMKVALAARHGQARRSGG